MNQNKSEDYITNKIFKPNFPANILVKSHSAMPVSEPIGGYPTTDMDWDFDQIAKIRAVGIGPLGSSIAKFLSVNSPGIICHEVLLELDSERSEDITSLLSSVQQSDLLFIITGFDDEYCTMIAEVVGNTACKVGVPTILLTPFTNCLPDILPQFVTKDEKWHDIVFFTSENFTVSHQIFTLDEHTLKECLLCHAATLVTTLVTQWSLIGIDFYDVVEIMRSGNIGRIGVGVASGPSRGETAATHAIECLLAQGVKISNASGVLACVHGSFPLSMDDFDAASKKIHDLISKDANLIIGLIFDEKLESNVKVTIMSVYQG